MKKRSTSRAPSSGCGGGQPRQVDLACPFGVAALESEQALLSRDGKGGSTAGLLVVMMGVVGRRALVSPGVNRAFVSGR